MFSGSNGEPDQVGKLTDSSPLLFDQRRRQHRAVARRDEPQLLAIVFALRELLVGAGQRFCRPVRFAGWPGDRRS